MLRNLDTIDRLVGFDSLPLPGAVSFPSELSLPAPAIDLSADLVELTLRESEAEGESFHIRIAN